MPDFCPFIPQTYLRIDGLKEPGPCLDLPPLLCHSSHSAAVCGRSSLAKRLDKEEDGANSSPRVWPEERLQNLPLQCFNSIKLRWKLFIKRSPQLLSVCRATSQIHLKAGACLALFLCHRMMIQG